MMVKQLINVITGSHRDDENDEAVVTPEEPRRKRKESKQSKKIGRHTKKAY
jgi:hypothetical protein